MAWYVHTKRECRHVFLPNECLIQIFIWIPSISLSKRSYHCNVERHKQIGVHGRSLGLERHTIRLLSVGHTSCVDLSRSCRSDSTLESYSCSLVRQCALECKLRNAAIKVKSPWDEYLTASFSLSPCESPPLPCPCDDEPDEEPDEDDESEATCPDEPDDNPEDKPVMEWAEPDDRLEIEPEIVFWSPPNDEPSECPNELQTESNPIFFNSFKWIDVAARLTCDLHIRQTPAWSSWLSEQG